MKHLHTVFLSLALMACCAPSAAIAGEDSGYSQVKGKKQLRALFEGRTAISEYREEGGGIEGELYTELHNSDGTTDYIEKGTKGMIGLWSIIGDDKICYKYPDSAQFTQTYCFVVYENDSCYYNYGTSAMSYTGPYDWDLWTSRFVIRGEGGSCSVGAS